MTYPGGGQGGWGDESGQGGWGQQGDYNTGGYPSTGGFPQQGYGGSYGGLGVFSGGEEPPEKDNKKLWLIIGAVVLVLLAGGGVTTFLLLKSGDEQSVANTSSAAPEPTSETEAPASTTTPKPSGAACKPRKAGMTCVPTPANFSYDVPKGWTPADATIPVAEGVALSGVSSYGDYKCDGKGYTKGTNGATLLEKGEINKIAADFAKTVATNYYSSAPTHEVTLSAPKPVKFKHTQKDGKPVDIEGVQVDASVTTSGNKCLASKGMVKVLVLVGSTKYHAMVANGDLEGGGGGDNPPLPKEAELQAMIDSVTPLT